MPGSKFDKSSARSAKDWIGHRRVVTSKIDVRTTRLMQALFDRPAEANTGDRLPPLWHWAFFPSLTGTSELGDDGHPILGKDLPDLELPRRMWAAGSLDFKSEIRVGDVVERETVITSMSRKSGRSGPLGFVELQHAHRVNREVVLVEAQTLVYRPAAIRRVANVPSPKSPAVADQRQTVTPSTVLLFKYSALTHNAHRIHFDRNYARDVEAYEGLVVHGPLIATLISNFVEAIARPARLSSFSFRALKPLFDAHDFDLCVSSDRSTAWAEGPNGHEAMHARLTWS